MRKCRLQREAKTVSNTVCLKSPALSSTYRFRDQSEIDFSLATICSIKYTTREFFQSVLEKKKSKCIFNLSKIIYEETSYSCILKTY